MAISYQYDAEGYFAGEIEDYGLLPNNATYAKAPSKEGYIAKWAGEKWELVENHKGKEGYLNGEPHTIKEYGALPKGWSDTAPELTEEEKAKSRIQEIDTEIQELEKKALRPLFAIQTSTAENFDKERLAEIMDKIIDLRCERQLLESSLAEL